MSRSTVQADRHDDVPETRPAGQSAGDPTRTGEPLGSPRIATASTDPVPATRLRDPDRYRIVGEHGRGGLGRVSRVHDRDLGRDIAIKELISRGHLGELRFLREALITARLEHPGIVPVYEAGRWPDGTPFYAMKLVAGRSLRALIAERTTVEDRLALLHHVIAVADAIAYAHGRAIIHRDLKPANIIVGDFGETIVIDWGLAKDLSVGEESLVGGGPFRRQADEGLTSTGSVLGTPAYMAPEQQRGEAVDQRADVFAIGAMLWELCSLEKLPPSDSGQRGRILRRAGIDPDLATIIVKALAPDPRQRYPDAGALAADLKAFKAGARIAARRYSLFALLAHWTRRHRALAISVATVVALATAGIATYIRHIAAERDRVAAASNALILEHAQLLLHSDPTTAFDVVHDYDGPEPTRREMLQAEALGLGVARLRATPHKVGAYLAQLADDGTLMSFGADGDVIKTPLDGANPSRVLMHVPARPYAYDYSASRRWLATTCPATTICLFDVRAERAIAPPVGLSSFVVVSLAWSPGGGLLAALSAHGEIAIWESNDLGAPVPRRRLHLDGGRALRFVDDHTLVVQTPTGLHLLDPDATGSSAIGDEVAVAKTTEIEVRGDLHLVASGTEDGQLVAIDPRTEQIVQRRSVCKGYVNKPFLFRTRPAIAYACRDGDVGVWDLARDQADVVVRLSGGATRVAGSADGRYLIAGSVDGVVALHDFATGVSSSYLGHSFRITMLLPPTPGSPRIVTGDSAGELRVWPLPDDRVRVAIHTATPMARAVPLWGGGPVIAVGSGPTIPWYSQAGAGEAPGHLPMHGLIAISKTLPRAVMYGGDDELELWSFAGVPERRTRRTGRGATTGVAYLPDGTHFVVAGSDGSVIEWSDDGLARQVRAVLPESAAFVTAVRNSAAAIALGVSGTVWLVDRDGARYLGSEPEQINSIATSPDSRWLAIANARGTVRMYNLVTRQFVMFESPRPSSEFLEFAPDNSVLAIATDSTISLRPLPCAPEAGPGPRWTWHDIDLAVHHFTFSPDGMWFAGVCDHGGIWFSRRGEARWKYFSTGSTRISFGYFSPDSSQFVATDISGRALIIDVRPDMFDRDRR